MPAPEADGPFLFAMAADVELVTTTAPSIEIAIMSVRDVLLVFMMLLLEVCGAEAFKDGGRLFLFRIKVKVTDRQLIQCA
jgi:hypothetical protein